MLGTEKKLLASPISWRPSRPDGWESLREDLSMRRHNSPHENIHHYTETLFHLEGGEVCRTQQTK